VKSARGTNGLVAAIRHTLRAAAQPAQAGAMQAYMKSAMPFLGVAAPERRRAVAQAVRAHALADAGELAQAVLALWRQATHREERYAALDLLRLHRKLMDVPLLPLAQELLTTDPWWDFNDEISGQVLPRLLQASPATMKPLPRSWARGSHLWLRRAAMLAQRSLKPPHFDAVLLYDCILPSLAPSPLAREFFITKGMGWALRERSYGAPDEVRAFCREYADRLAPLTVREALKVLRKREAAAGASAA
jgi:3-methyladenine DNA glycosylase AlkD